MMPKTLSQEATSGVPFPCPLHEKYRSVAQLKPDQVQDAEEKLGIQIKFGNMSARENRILKRNLDRCVEKKITQGDKRPIKDITLELLGFMQERDYSRDYSFISELGRDLPDRTLCSIYHRARNAMAPLKQIGDVTESERKKLLEHYKTYGKAWKAMLQECGVTIHPRAMQGLIRNSFNPMNKEIVKRRKWTKEEDDRLVAAIKKLLSISNLKDAINVRIPWVKVAKKVKTQGDKACRQRFKVYWVPRVKNNLSEVDITSTLIDSEENIQNCCKVLYFLYHESDNVEDEIEWDVLKDKLPNLTLRQIMIIWDDLKREIPREFHTSYKDGLDYLYKRWLPKYFDVTNSVAMNELHRFYSN